MLSAVGRGGCCPLVPPRPLASSARFSRAGDLKLSRRPFAGPVTPRDVADALLAGEAHFGDLALIVGKPPPQREKFCQILCLLLVRLFKSDGRLNLPFPGEPLGAVGDG